MFYFCYSFSVMLEEIAELSLLYDFYGNLLSEKQRRYFELYNEDNLSLTEIAQECGVSKQAVSKNLKTAESALRSYEEKMGLLKEYLSKKDQN